MNHYDVLGVARTADPAVIKAAYKVLVQKYHPDRYSGSDAKDKIISINLAFETLSNPDLRRSYDEGLKEEVPNEEEYSGEDAGGFVYSEIDWEYACKYTSDLKDVDNQLASVSLSLSSFFRAFILETKDFKNARSIAKEIEGNYLRKYFGESPMIVNFARQLLLAKRLAAAKELNRVVNRLGSNVDPLVVISRETLIYSSPATHLGTIR